MNNEPFDILGLMQGPHFSNSGDDIYTNGRMEVKYPPIGIDDEGQNISGNGIGLDYAPFTPAGLSGSGQSAMANFQQQNNINSAGFQTQLTPSNIELHNNLQNLRTPPDIIKTEQSISPNLDFSTSINGNFNTNNSISGDSNNDKFNTTARSTFSHHRENSNPGDNIDDKKKAQNRAAQRAFRERKEAKFKELQRKVRESEIDRDQLLKELEKLRKWNMEINAENRKLLQKERLGNNGVYSGNMECSSSQSLPNMEQTTYIFPSTNECFEQSINQKNLRDKNPEQIFERKPVYSAAGRFLQYEDEYPDDVLLTVPETWEYLSQLSENEEFDVHEVMERLVGLEQCHPSGPAYSKQRIDNLVKQSIENNR